MGLERKRLNSVFGAVTFGFKEALFLDVTARNDWSSALAYTDGYSSSILRWAPAFCSTVSWTWAGISTCSNSAVRTPSSATTSPSTRPTALYLRRPRRHQPARIGAVPHAETRKDPLVRGRFRRRVFQHRLHVNATYYKTNTKNQYFEVTLPWESGYKSQFVNAGNVQNQGFELTAGWFQDFGNEFTWSTLI